MKKLITALFALSAVTAFANTANLDSASTTVEVKATVTSTTKGQLIITTSPNSTTSVSKIEINHGELSTDESLTKDSAEYFLRRVNGSTLFDVDKNKESVAFSFGHNSLGLNQIELSSPDTEIKLISDLTAVTTENTETLYQGFKITSAITKASFNNAAAGEYTGSTTLNITVNN